MSSWTTSSLNHDERAFEDLMYRDWTYFGIDKDGPIPFDDDEEGVFLQLLLTLRHFKNRKLMI